MITQRLINLTRIPLTRNFGVCYPLAQKATDPIQQLFLDKVREYRKKGGDTKLVDPSPEMEREWKQELVKLSKQYGGGDNVDMTKFPDFKFVDAPLDPINLETK